VGRCLKEDNFGVNVGGDGFISVISQVPGRSQAPRKRNKQLSDGVSGTQNKFGPGQGFDSVRQRSCSVLVSKGL
jgi:hypothetical protein